MLHLHPFKSLHCLLSFVILLMTERSSWKDGPQNRVRLVPHFSSCSTNRRSPNQSQKVVSIPTIENQKAYLHWSQNSTCPVPHLSISEKPESIIQENDVQTFGARVYYKMEIMDRKVGLASTFIPSDFGSFKPCL